MAVGSHTAKVHKHSSLRVRRNKFNLLSVKVYNCPKTVLPSILNRPPVSPITPIEQRVAQEVGIHDMNQNEVFTAEEMYMAGLLPPVMYKGYGIPVFRFHLDPAMFQYSQTMIANRSCQRPALESLPFEILIQIYHELETPSQVCLALASKTLACASGYTHNFHGIYYSRGERMRTLWNLSAWMTPARSLCFACEMYYPVSAGVWEKRLDEGRSRTSNIMYGNSPNDFSFEDGFCPECVAESSWIRLKETGRKLQAITNQ
ncbi:hypothetical protein FQN57_000371 [Myotisia sp. PD_48]|nr:hypothetical protein FQN57_000371 [Myotisia sp. PD_48]